jgi:Uma2 family endonuclease
MTVLHAKPEQITAEQLLAMGDIGRCELIDGEIIHMAPAGAEHGGIAMEIAYRIKAHVTIHHLGKVFAAETGFLIKRNPDLVRAPDIAFVGASRIPAGPVRGFFEGPPDLAVEVCFPGDRWSDVLAKVDQWLAAGTISIWVVDPLRQSFEIYRRDSQPMRCHAGQRLADEPTLPGFVLEVAEVFK